MTIEGLSRRERQIMDVIYRMGEAAVSEVRDEMEDAPSYSAVRAMLRILEEKGQLTHRQDGPRYVYGPVRPIEEATESALERVLSTFFEGSAERAMAALLDMSSTRMSSDELDRLSKMIEAAREEGR